MRNPLRPGLFIPGPITRGAILPRVGCGRHGFWCRIWRWGAGTPDFPHRGRVVEWPHGSLVMKRMVLALSVMVAAAPASAQTIRPQDAIAHIGETATVEGRAHIQKMPSGEIYLDLAGRGDDAPISGYVSRWNA